MKINLFQLIGTIFLVVSPPLTFGNILFFDNFQKSDVSEWLTTRANKDKISISDYQGNKTLNLKGSTYAVKSVSTEGYRNIRFSSKLYGYSLEEEEKCKLQVSVDGGKHWRKAGELGSHSDDGITPIMVNHYWSEADNRKQILLRISSNGNQIHDNCYFDDIKVIGEKNYKSEENKYGNDQFSYHFLSSNKGTSSPVNTLFFKKPDGADTAANKFEGILDYQGKESHSIELIEDVFSFRGEKSRLQYDSLPDFKVELVQHDDNLIPVQRGSQLATHPHWEIVIGPGKVWDDISDGGYSRAALPFALQEKGANCIHNGLMTFLFKSDGEISRVMFQIGSETCAYFKFDMWGSFKPTYQSNAVPEKDRIISAYSDEIKNRLPTKAIEALKEYYPSLNTNMFGSVAEVHPSNMSTYGVVFDGIHYVSQCHTRFGAYPYCDVMDLPSYSTAKSINALAYISLVKRYPKMRAKTIAELVPACANKNQWKDVTVEHALNMTTGNYDNDGFEVDEYVSMAPFFDANTHSAKTKAACRFKRKTEPGSKWVYHTSDTYLYGVALNNFWKMKNNNNADYYDDILAPIWDKLGLSPLMSLTRRTYDARRQPYAGYGMTYNRGDIAKLGSALIPNDEQINKFVSALDIEQLRSALQMNSRDRGMVVREGTKYKHAFWAWNASEALGCSEPVWIPFMSGYGGITVAMLPNGLVYYYFSDNYDYRWRNAVLAANDIRSLCQ